MNSSYTFIGMPGSGKSTIGKRIAEYFRMPFVDTDSLIELETGSSLQSFLDAKGYEALRNIEEEVILNLDPQGKVIATGGSAVYSKSAMSHLAKNSTLIYLNVCLAELQSRVQNLDTRGLAKPEGQNFEMLYMERTPLYQSFADISVDCDGKTEQQVVVDLLELF